MGAVRARPRGQLVPLRQPVTCANGTACRTGGRTVTLADGVRMAGRVSLLTGSGFRGARSLIIPFRTGAARQAGGAIRSSGVLAGHLRGGNLVADALVAIGRITSRRSPVADLTRFPISNGRPSRRSAGHSPRGYR